MLADDVKERKAMLQTKLEESQQLDTLVQDIQSDTYLNIYGKQWSIEEDVRSCESKLIKKFNQPDKIEDAIPTANKAGKILRIGAEINIGLEEYLYKTLKTIMDAVAIYESTKDSDEDKLQYILTTKDLNPHLLQTGYLDEIITTLQDKLDQFSYQSKVQYFRLTASRSQFLDGGFRVEVSLNQRAIPSITMYTALDLEKEECTYPQYIGVSEKYSSLLINKGRLTTLNEYNERDCRNMVERYKSTKEDLRKYQSKKFSKKMNHVKIKNLQAQVDIQLSDIVDKMRQVYELRYELLSYINVLTTLENQLPALLEEKREIMNYLGTLLNITIKEDTEKTFSN